MFYVDNEMAFASQIALLCLATFLILYLTRRFIRKRLKKLRNIEGHYWQRNLLNTVNLPLSLAIITVGLSSTFATVARHYSWSIVGTIETIRSVFIIVLTTWFLLRITSKIEPYLVAQRKYKIDKASADTVVKLITITIFLSGSLALLDAFGFSIQTVLAFGGLSSVILGLAAKDFIAGLFGTFIIYFDKPFVVGDAIKINIDKPFYTEGVVEKITWRLTQIRSLDKKTIFIPNSQFSSILVENSSRLSHHKLVLHLKIALNSQGDHIENIINQVVDSLQHSDTCIHTKDTTIEIDAITEAEIGIKFTLYLQYSPDKPQRLRNMKLKVTLATCNVMNNLGLRFNGKIEG